MYLNLYNMRSAIKWPLSHRPRQRDVLNLRMLTLLFYPLGTNRVQHRLPPDVSLLVELIIAGALEEVLFLAPALVVAPMRVGAFKLPLTTLFHASDKYSACFYLFLRWSFKATKALAIPPYSSLTRLTPFRAGARVSGCLGVGLWALLCCAVQN
ncbi:hypothetical protein F4859DRAFT_27556 [Xylaria cf. heliscus]|nr:hypothetical protein F4859DRAFT_27556 [Xylaria cf. heliscus]